MVKVNTKDVPVGYQPLPDGTYKGTFTNFRNGKTKTTPTKDKIDFEFTVSEPEEYAGRKLFMTQSIVTEGEDQNLHFLKEVMIHLGADPDDLETTWDSDVMLQELRGNEVVMKVTLGDEYNGKVNNRVRLTSPDSWEG